MTLKDELIDDFIYSIKNVYFKAKHLLENEEYDYYKIENIEYEYNQIISSIRKVNILELINMKHAKIKINKIDALLYSGSGKYIESTFIRILYHNYFGEIRKDKYSKIVEEYLNTMLTSLDIYRLFFEDKKHRTTAST